MASKINMMALVMVLIVPIFWDGALAQSSCMTTLVGLSPCLNYVSGNSSTPSSSCCTSLSSVVQSNPQCLCMLVNGGGSNLGVVINQTLALGLPSACNVQTPPLSRCNGKIIFRSTIKPLYNDVVCSDIFCPMEHKN